MDVKRKIPSHMLSRHCGRLAYKYVYKRQVTCVNKSAHVNGAACKCVCVCVTVVAKGSPAKKCVLYVLILQLRRDNAENSNGFISLSLLVLIGGIFCFFFFF